jgi:ECF transporter S component (folate family)
LLQKGFDFMKKRISTKKICTLGLLTAITVILGVFATFRIGNLMKIPMKFVTVFIVGALYGPFSARSVAAIADLIEASKMGINLLITAVEFLCGFVFGACFYKAKDGKRYYLRVLVCAFLQFLIAFFIMSNILAAMGIYAGFWAAVWMRLPQMIILFVLHTGVMCGGRRLIFQLRNFISKERGQ